MSEQQTQKYGAQNAPDGEIRFTVYGDPVPKARPRVVNNHAYTPSRTKDHETKIALVYKSIYHGVCFEKGVPLRMETDFYIKIPQSASKKARARMESGEERPTKKSLDVDNCGKLVADALNGVAYHDDSQIVEMAARKFYGEPRTEIHVEKI